MSIESSRNDIQSATYSKQNGATTVGRAAKSLTDPSLLVASLGLACLFAVNQGMRITTLAGIYPVEGSLVLRHLLSVGALLLVILALYKQKTLTRLTGVGGYALVGVLLTGALLARYATIFTADPPPAIELVGKLTEEALCILLVVFWANQLLKRGLVLATTTVAYAFLAQAAIQLLLSFLQRVPCAVMLSLLPLLSIWLFRFYIKSTSAAAEMPGPTEDFVPKTTGSTLTTMGLAAGVVFCLSFILGGVISESLEAQNAMAHEPIAQLCIIGGNVLGAFILVVTAPHIRNRAYCVIFLMGCFACCAVALYLTTFLVDEAVGGYLVASSIGLQGTLMFIWYAPFLVGGNTTVTFRHFVGLYAVYCGAKVVSSLCMLLNRVVFDHLFSVLISVALVGLFCCCALVIIRSLDAARASVLPVTIANSGADGAANAGVASGIAAPSGESAPASTSPTTEGADPGASASTEAEPETEKRAFFREAVDSLANEYGLTRQERRVLMLVAKGLNAGAISEEMVVSVNTAKSHMRNAYAKLNVHSQQEIIALVNERKAELRDTEGR